MKRCTTCSHNRPLSDYGSFTMHETRYWRGECNPCRRTREKSRRDADLDNARARDRARYHNNPQRREDTKRRAGEWTKAHPEVLRRVWERRRARRVGAPEVEKFDRTEIFVRDAGKCCYCGGQVDPENWHLAHLVALARGGSHTRANVAVSHPTCNWKDHTGRLPVQLILLPS